MALINRFGLTKVKFHHHLILASIIRAVFLLFGEWQDRHFQVKYTDVDYRVFTDGAQYVSIGQSPFLRDTYRYTPLLAVLLVPNVLLHFAFGKVIFSLADIFVGHYIHKAIRAAKFSERKATLCSTIWLYNPCTLTISTRGNADSLLSLLIVFMVFCIFKSKDIRAGIAYGFSVHFKMYTAIYALPLYFCLQAKSNKNESESLRTLLGNLFLPNRRKAIFFSTAAMTFLIPTIISYLLYGMDYLHEVFIYHITRKDIHHNFSSFFYMLYLNDKADQANAVLAFLPQLLLLLMVSIKYSNLSDLPFCLFSETFVFVVFNKVCTSQYFVWYLCLLPLALPKMTLTLRNSIFLILMWVGGQALWLAEAYYLEFKGKNVFLYVWIAGLIFLVSNTFILCYMISNYAESQKRKPIKQK